MQRKSQISSVDVKTGVLEYKSRYWSCLLDDIGSCLQHARAMGCAEVAENGMGKVTCNCCSGTGIWVHGMGFGRV